ncbi:MAG: RDD family protein [Gammaproteobacteria bacterium]|nr:RDD family protein [Gammaproteobacteria bacterium]
MDEKSLDNAGFLRRLAAIIYDTFLLLGVLFIAGLPLPLLPDHWQHTLPVSLAIRGYLLLVSFIFFGWFWINGGQTLGMRAWGLRLIGADGASVTWSQACQRFFGAILSWGCVGLGFIWMLFSPDKLAWHDWLSDTRIVRIIK